MQDSTLEMAREIVQGEILSGNLDPGQRLKEKHLLSIITNKVKEKWGEQVVVTRTPLRAAISRLEVRDGPQLIRKFGKKSHVVQLDRDQIWSILLARKLMEGDSVVKLAKSDLDESKIILNRLHGIEITMEAAKKTSRMSEFFKKDLEFHFAILELAHGSMFSDLLRPKLEQLAIHQMSHDKKPKDGSDPKKEILIEHAAIMDAIQKGNGKLARECLVKHLVKTSERMGCKVGWETDGD